MYLGIGGQLIMVVSTKKIKCPECLNYMNIKVNSNGTSSGHCSVCKSAIYSKQNTPKEKIIKITKN